MSRDHGNRIFEAIRLKTPINVDLIGKSAPKFLRSTVFLARKLKNAAGGTFKSIFVGSVGLAEQCPTCTDFPRFWRELRFIEANAQKLF